MLTLILALALPGQSPWRVASRVVNQDGGSWVVDYRLVNDGPAVTLAPSDLSVTVDGWVSNSRAPGHSHPRRSTIEVGGGDGTATADVIGSGDASKRCRERLVLRAWREGDAEPAARPKDAPPNAPDPLPAVGVPSGATLAVRIGLGHEHHLCELDPLLGIRTVELRLGAATIRDEVDLSREHHTAYPAARWPAPPRERLDARESAEGPDSLHLDAAKNGDQYYRFPDVPVRPGATYRLTYWYLIAPGGEREFRAKFTQMEDGPDGWKILDAGWEVTHRRLEAGRWAKVERVIRVAPGANRVSLDFHLGWQAEVGEAWIDGVKLEPAGARRETP